MKSHFANWASLATAAACLAIGVAGLQWIPSTEGDSMSSTHMVAAANADETNSEYTTILAQGMGGGMGNVTSEPARSVELSSL